MINLFGIIILLCLQAILILSIVRHYQYKVDKIDNEILERDRENAKKTDIIKEKNHIIELQDSMIRDLNDEIKELKRKCNKRLRKDN